MVLRSFVTRKDVEIYDSKLIRIARITMFLLFMYTVVYEMLYKGGHLESVTVSGGPQYHIHHPLMNNCEMNTAGCIGNWTQTESLPYCRQSPLSYNGLKRHCVVHDASYVVDSTTDGISLATRLQKFRMVRVCNENSTVDCVGRKRYNHSLVYDHYTTDAERFLLYISHSFWCPRPQSRGSNAEFPGYVKNCADCEETKLPKVDLNWDSAAQVAVDSEESMRADPEFVQHSGREMSLLERTRRQNRAHFLALARREKAQGRKQERRSSQSLSSERDLSRKRQKQVSGLRSYSAESLQHNRLKDIDRPSSYDAEHVDILPIHNLLDMAKLGLDQPFRESTHRSLGAVIALIVRYTNDRSSFYEFVGLKILPRTQIADTIRYTYHTEYLPDDNYVSSPDLDGHGESYELRYKYGIRIMIKVDGELLIWSWSKIAMFIGAMAGIYQGVMRGLHHYFLLDPKFSQCLVEKYEKDPTTGDYNHVQ
eukprot:TRINITY_DN26139_c0_g1_i1.p1 TRINITY_DN26139_c0_g1~~TRINITY_DN26139_c0_g1_i1.p1  ORF type:complete len:508 (+),score=12.87 TRINITY_DN26139_c0_g1_i1:87-1526(+)